MTEPTQQQVDAAKDAARKALRTYFHTKGNGGLTDTDIVTDVAYAIAEAIAFERHRLKGGAFELECANCSEPEGS